MTALLSRVPWLLLHYKITVHIPRYKNNNIKEKNVLHKNVILSVISTVREKIFDSLYGRVYKMSEQRACSKNRFLYPFTPNTKTAQEGGAGMIRSVSYGFVE